VEFKSEGRKPGRALSLDAMRGVAALVVVLYHALGVAPQTAFHGWQWWLPTVAAYVVHFGYAGVYLFFVISGFCIHLHWARALSRYCWRWVSRSGCRRLIIWRGFTMPAGC